MNTMKFIICLLFSCFVLTNCGDTFSTVVEIDPPEFEKRMTVSAIFTAGDTTAQFFVGQNKSILNQDGVDDYGLADAEISITNESNNLISVFQPSTGPAWQNTYNYEASFESADYLQPGGNYTFIIKHQEFNTSETTLSFPPERAVLRNLEYVAKSGITIDGEDQSSVNLEIIDEPTTEDYYELEMSAGFDDPNLSSFIFWIETIDPVGVKGFPYDNLFISDATFNGQTKKISVTFESDSYRPGAHDKIQIKWRSISKGTYEYNKSLRRQLDTKGTPFLSPVQIYSNMNDALGTVSMRTETIYELR